MGILQKISLTLFTKVGIGRVAKMKMKQLTLDQVPGMIISSTKSLERFEIPQEMIKLMKEGENIKVQKEKRCFEYFAQYYGCSVCIKACPFSEGGDTYERLKVSIANHN